MIDEPHIATLPERPYVAIAATVGMADLATVVPPLNGEVFGWLAARGIEPAGPPLWRYNVIDMARGLEVEAGVPVAEVVAGDGRVIAGVLPAGRYVIMRHVGHPDELRPVGCPAGDLPLRPGCGAGHDQVGDRARVPAG